MAKKSGIAAILSGALFVIYGIAVTAYNGSGTPMLWAWYVIGTVLIINGIIAVRSKKHNVTLMALAVNFVAAVFIACGAVFSSLAVSDMDSVPKKGCEYVIILGAAVNGNTPSEALQKRIDAAYSYLLENKSSIAVGTGGKGEGENISEGRCIAESLEKMGVDKSRIIYEETSGTTVENFDNALEMIGDSNRIAVVSSGFHVFRAKLLLSCRTEAEISVIPASGADFMTPHYMLREYVVFLVDIILGNYRVNRR